MNSAESQKGLFARDAADNAEPNSLQIRLLEDESGWGEVHRENDQSQKPNPRCYCVELAGQI